MARTQTGAPAHAPADRGVSLVEVMVAMALFVAGSLSLLSVLTSTVSGTFDNRARITAANLAAGDIDEARSLDYYSLGNLDVTKTVDGRDYRIVRTVATTMASGANTSSCVGAGSAKQLYKRVTTRVETAFQGTAQPVRADTLVKAPVFDPNSARGAIAFQVIDRTGAPLAGLPVSIPGTNLTSDSRGCAFFDALLPASYDVTVQKSGAVRIDGSSSLTKSVAVSAGQISADVLRIDTAATVTVMSNVFNGSTAVTGYTMPSGVQATIAAPDRGSVTRTTYPSKAVTAGADLVWPVYPAPGGYDAWLGPCSPVRHSDSEPATTPPRTVLPLSPVTVQLTATNGSGNANGRGRSVTVSWVSSPSCTETLTFATSTGTGCNATSNGSDGCYLYFGVPAGTWNFKVDGTTSNTTATVANRTATTVKIDVT